MQLGYYLRLYVISSLRLASPIPPNSNRVPEQVFQNQKPTYFFVSVCMELDDRWRSWSVSSYGIKLGTLHDHQYLPFFFFYFSFLLPVGTTLLPRLGTIRHGGQNTLLYRRNFRHYGIVAGRY